MCLLLAAAGGPVCDAEATYLVPKCIAQLYHISTHTAFLLVATAEPATSKSSSILAVLLIASP